MNTETTPNRQTGFNGSLLRKAMAFRFLPLLVIGLIACPLRADQFGDFTYTNNTTHITITGYTGSGGAVVIPSTIVGLPVTGIGNQAFYFKTNVTSVTIPGSVTSIGNLALYGCSGLTSLSIPSSVTSVGTYAFSYCSALPAITVDASNPSYSSLDGVFFNKLRTTLIQYPGGKTGAYAIPATVANIGDWAFTGTSGLTGITIPNGVVTIGSSAFQYCNGITSLAIPASVTTIGSFAFGYLYNLPLVTIPSSVSSIGNGAFTYCLSLTAITVDSSNSSYSSSGGVLFDKSMTSLIQFPNGRSGSYTIPASVTTISADAFSSSFSLTSVTIPDAVTSIGTNAFVGCASLSAIDVSIGNPAFMSEQGILFNKIQSTLIQYPGGKSGSYVIPATVSLIQAAAFFNASVTSVTIPGSVLNVGSQAFFGCYNLASATFTGNAPSLGSQAFVNSGGGVPGGFKIYFYSGATGFTAPTWQGYPSEMLTGGGVMLANALDAPSLTFTTGGSIPWFAQSTVNYDGIDAAASGDIGNNQESWMETTVTGPGTISFWWAVASDPNDGLAFYVNGLQQSGPISGNVPWEQKSHVLGAGSHTLRWRYSKDSFGDWYSDTAWVDQVVWTPGGGGNPTDLTWTDNGSFVTITGYTGSGGSVVIPPTIGGLPVTAIGAYAFDSKFSVTGVSIPSSVTSIGNYAFMSCSSLASLTIPSSVTSIGWQAFSYCYSLTSVSIPSGVTSIGSGAFSGCNSLTSISVDGSNPAYSSSGGVLFNKMQTALIQYPGGKSGSYLIPSGVTSIESSSFEYCAGLTSVTISASVSSIGLYAFNGCSNLASFSVDVSNNFYSASSGVLFNKAQTILIQYPRGKSGAYSIPSGVTTIESQAFNSCSGLTSLTIPSSATSIGSFAFYFCTGLTSVTIQPGLTVIGPYAFYYCNKLSSVTIPSSVTNIGTAAFRYSALLTGATFQGNAPSTFGTNVFDNAASGFTVYYYGGTTGFTSPTWQGYPSQMLTAGSGFTSWASAGGLSGNNALPGAIPYGDGVPNLLKFAFGLNASGPDARRMVVGGTVGLPAGYLHQSGGTVWRVEYLRRKNSGLTYTPKKSTTLAGGSFAALTGTPVVTSIDTNWERVVIDEPFNPSTTPKLFTTVEVVGE